MRKTLVSIGLAATFALGATAAAGAPFALPANSPLYIKYDNLEQVCATNCIGNTSATAAVWNEGNWGLVNVSTVNVGSAVALPPNSNILNGSPTLFADGLSGGHITGIFYGIQLDAGGTTAKGGVMDLYWHDDPTNTNPFILNNELTAGIGAIAAKRTAQDTYTGYTSGTFLIELLFAPGADPLCATCTVSSTTIPTTGTGSAFSYQDVNLAKVGTWTNQLNGDWFKLTDLGAPLVAGTRDFRTQSDYTPAIGWNNITVESTIVGLASHDPVRAFSNAVPEPTTLLLMGAGLLGAGIARRRRSA